MKVLVLGAGVVGVTTAYFLAKNGHEVTVVDRGEEPASECSYANGGQLSYTHAEPWANPAVLKKAIGWLGRKNAPLLFNLRADADQWKWIFKFLMNCGHRTVDRNIRTILRLNLYSRLVMQEIREDVDFDYRNSGIIHFFRKANDMENALRLSELQHSLGAPYERLTTEKVIEREPALKNIANRIVGGILYPLDESGDVHKFTIELAKKCQSMGVEFLYKKEITEIRLRGSEIYGVQCGRDLLEADKYVVALGAYSPVYTKAIGVKLPMYPLKGYSISIDNSGSEESSIPSYSLTDQEEKVVYSKLGNILRVAGTAEFAGYNDDINDYRVGLLKKLVAKTFPGCKNIKEASEWACLRPSTPDNIPILGKTKYPNLVLNTGHGSLGWTQAAASAKIVSQIIDDQRPPIDISGMTLDRF